MNPQKYIVDTYAWIEYFRGSNQELKHIIEKEILYTPTLVLSELKKKYVEDNVSGFDVNLEDIRSRSRIINLDEKTAVRAGEIRATTSIKGMGIVDCVIIASAEINDAKVLTGDPHFRGVERSVLIENLGGA